MELKNVRYSPPIIHKSQHRSSVEDPEASGFSGRRTTFCDSSALNTEVSKKWVNVDCHACLRFKAEADMNNLPLGTVLSREANERLVVCRSKKKCNDCKVIPQYTRKCVRYEKGNVYLFHICLDCYKESI